MEWNMSYIIAYVIGYSLHGEQQCGRALFI